MTPSTELVVQNAANVAIGRRDKDDFLPVLSIQDALDRRNVIKEFISAVLVEGIDGDYGTIPGSRKPTLLKPGAEKLCSLFGLVPEYIVLAEVLDWTGEDHGGEPFFYVKYKCRLSRQGRPMGEADGSCNSWEPKYRYRENQRTCPACGKETIIKGKAEYGGGWLCFKKRGGCGAKYADNAPEIVNQSAGKVANPDIAESVNTLHKIAQKRAYISATTGTTGASQFFTVDIEPDAALPAEIAETKIAAMKENVPYTEISEPDPRREPELPPAHVIRPEDVHLDTSVPFLERPGIKPDGAPGGSAKKPFSMAASIKAFEDLKLAMNKDLGELEANRIYYGTLGAQGFEHCNELKTAKEARATYKVMDEAYKQALTARDADDKNAFDEHMKQWTGNVKTVPTSQLPVG